MLVYLSQTDSSRKEQFEELPPKDFKLTLQDAGKVSVEDIAGNRETLDDLDCLIMRKIKEACKEAESKG
jgi:hypothetical protein